MKKILSLISASAVFAPAIAMVACGNSNGGVEDKKINTVLLTPDVIYKSNLNQFFEKNGQDYNEVYQPPAFGGTKSDKKLVSVVSDPENPRWQKAKQEIQKSGDEVFAQTTTDIKKESAEQNSWLKTKKDDGDAFVIGATDDSLSNFISSTDKPVVAYDRLIKANFDNYNWYVTFDNSKVGFLQGATILGSLYDIDEVQTKTEAQILEHVETNKLSAEKGIISVAGDPADNNAHLFFDGAKDLIKKAMEKDSNLKWYGSDEFDKNAQDKWDYAKGKTYLQTTINSLNDTQKSNIAAVLSPNDGMADSAITALTDASLDPKTIFITGQDSNTQGLDHIGSDEQGMTIFKPDSKAARLAVAVASNLSDGNEENNDKAGMKAFLEEAYPGIEFEIQFGDESTYSTKS